MRADVAEYKLIAIGRRLRHAVGADRSTRPGKVLHHHLPIKDLTQGARNSRYVVFAREASGVPSTDRTMLARAWG